MNRDELNELVDQMMKKSYESRPTIQRLKKVAREATEAAILSSCGQEVADLIIHSTMLAERILNLSKVLSKVRIPYGTEKHLPSKFKEVGTGYDIRAVADYYQNKRELDKLSSEVFEMQQNVVPKITIKGDNSLYSFFSHLATHLGSQGSCEDFLSLDSVRKAHVERMASGFEEVSNRYSLRSFKLIEFLERWELENTFLKDIIYQERDACIDLCFACEELVETLRHLNEKCSPQAS